MEYSTIPGCVIEMKWEMVRVQARWTRNKRAVKPLNLSWGWSVVGALGIIMYFGVEEFGSILAVTEAAPFKM